MGNLFQAWHPALSGLAGGCAVFLLARLSLRSRADDAGWTRIAPSLLHWVALAGSAGFVVVLGLVAAYQPPTAGDCACQRDASDIYAFYGLLVFFTMGAVWSAVAIRKIRSADVRWRAGELAFTAKRGGVRRCLLRDVEGFVVDWLDRVVLVFVDGTTLRLDRHARGVRDLCHAIVEANDARAAVQPPFGA